MSESPLQLEHPKDTSKKKIDGHENDRFLNKHERDTRHKEVEDDVSLESLETYFFSTGAKRVNPGFDHAGERIHPCINRPSDDPDHRDWIKVITDKWADHGIDALLR